VLFEELRTKVLVLGDEFTFLALRVKLTAEIFHKATIFSPLFSKKSGKRKYTNGE